jgi:hypothetical protein
VAWMPFWGWIAFWWCTDGAGSGRHFPARLYPLYMKGFITFPTGVEPVTFGSGGQESIRKPLWRRRLNGVF